MFSNISTINSYLSFCKIHRHFYCRIQKLLFVLCVKSTTTRIGPFRHDKYSTCACASVHVCIVTAHIIYVERIAGYLTVGAHTQTNHGLLLFDVSRCHIIASTALLCCRCSRRSYTAGRNKVVRIIICKSLCSRARSAIQRYQT